jgi:hypothetical protein
VTVRARFAAAALVLAAGPLASQGPAIPPRAEPLRVSSAVAPETVTVGDRFRTVLQVVAPEGATVEFAPLPVGDALQPADSLRVLPGREGEPPIAAYSLVAWAAGAPLRAQVPVRVARADGSAATYLVPLRLPVVRSVLPADTSEVQPRPARELMRSLRAPATWWPWLAAVLLALAGGAWLLLRRRGSTAPGAASPRDQALRALDGIERDWTSGAIDTVRLYPAATRALRGYLAALSGEWGPDLTSRELLERLARDGVDEGARTSLARLLEHADRVKFACYLPPPDETRRFLAGARAWVLAFPPEAAAAASAREAA